MFGAVVVLWLGSPAALAAHDADIAAFCAAKGLSARAPARTEAPAHDPSLADQIETWLEEARAAPTAAGASSAFERAERLLLAHPELPQAAWLLAERYASEAHAVGSRDDDAASVGRGLIERALRLEGPRARAVGATPLPVQRSLEASAARGAEQPLRGVRPLDLVFVDGEPSARRQLAPGRHHVQLVRASRPVWAGWVDGAPSEPGAAATAGVVLPDPTPACSDLDLADVSDGPEAPRVAPAVACPRWLAARAGVRGGTELAECAGSRCGPWQPSGAPAASAEARASAPLEAADSAPWPSWATWGLVGAGAAVATGLVLWQAGAFERSEPTTEFVFTGPSAAAYRF